MLTVRHREIIAEQWRSSSNGCLTTSSSRLEKLPSPAPHGPGHVQFGHPALPQHRFATRPRLVEQCAWLVTGSAEGGAESVPTACPGAASGDSATGARCTRPHTERPVPAADCP